MRTRVEWIEALDDARLAPYRAVRDRDLARSEGAFMLEGRVVLGAALTSPAGHRLRSVLVSGKRVERDAELLEQVPDTVPIYAVEQALMEAVVGFAIHRGLLAAAERPPARSPEDVLAELGQGPATVLVLEGLTNHDNVGACFRNAAAFGVDAVLLDGLCCDPLYRKAVRVSVGHVLRVPYGQAASSVALADALDAAGFASVALCLSPRATPLEALSGLGGRVALWLGTEGPGLRAETLARLERHVCIPMASGVDSLNVATAGAVGLYALRALRGA